MLGMTDGIATTSVFTRVTFVLAVGIPSVANAVY
jgi:hypothetical protein